VLFYGTISSQKGIITRGSTITCTSEDRNVALQGTQQAHTFQWQGKGARREKLHYLLYLPADYDTLDLQPSKRWPLMLFLHGAGERGNDLKLVMRHGPPRLVKEGQQFQFIIVSPQCPKNEFWTGKVALLAALLDEIKNNYAVDSGRMYLTGMSMGGYGTWALAIACPDRFAAIAPVCGGGNPLKVCAIRNVPVWCFHGAEDDIVPLEESQAMVDALEACGGNVRFTVYPHAGHDSWTQTYANPLLYAWFHEQVKLDNTSEER
jgi:predicted peptidase